MIYILYGNDTRKKNAYLKKLYKDSQPLFIPESGVTREVLLDYAMSRNLFDETSVIVFENVLKKEEVGLSNEDLEKLKESQTVIVFIEEKLLAADVKKYKKYSIIEDLGIEALKQTPKMNVFNIADKFSLRDKIGAWVLYREAVALGIQPEEISGIIFWKIKTMILTGTNFFSEDELKKQSAELVSLYHSAHRGECDFIIGLEQFILSALGKK